ncbi:hypothetical protein C8Q76DRAFT_438609 [Earliella scabrosa]|nr:hypothetical protein C8Q76DRAFT_438609 [Earliella scabrosa]
MPLSSHLRSCSGNRMPWPELPIDIIFTIAEFLRDDRKTLLACSLTNRAWLSASRSQLFHSIAITEWKTHIATFNDTLGSSLHIAGREYLQELHLVGISYTEERPQGSGKLAAVFHSFLDVAMMQSILEKLPALRQLHLYHLNLLSGTGCTPAPQGDRPRIDLLAVKGILSSSSSDNTFPALLDIVSLFSSIELLRLSVGHVDEAEEGMDTFGSVSNNPELNLAFRRPVTIGSLEWNATSHKVLAVVLNAIGKEPSAGLNSLSLTFGRSNRAVEVVASYLQLRGSSLHYLRIDPIYLCLSHQTDQQTRLDELSLSSCSNLTSLVLRLVNDSGGSGVSRHCVQTWADLLAGPRAPPALQRVSFTFSIPNAIEDDVLDYLTLLDHPLCNIPTLQKCEFAIYYLAPNYAMSVLRGRVQRALPVCHAKGLVEVVYMPDVTR